MRDDRHCCPSNSPLKPSIWHRCEGHGVDCNDHGHPAWRPWQLHNSAIFSASVLDAIGLERMISAGSAAPEILQVEEKENSQPSASGQLLTSLLSQSEDISIRNRAPERISIFSQSVSCRRARV
jgi:hypothetical protein